MSTCPNFETLPDRLRPWLFDKGSLTRSVTLACQCASNSDSGGQGFHMCVLSERVMRPLADECERLGLSQGESAVVREVHLMCSGQAWVYARSVIPHSTATEQQAYLKEMGDKPLGAALFADPTMRRDEIEAVSLLADARVADAQLADGERLWGRRSLFWVAEKPLLVAEYFLPAIPDHPGAAL